jgi:hypothetical protein
MSHGLWSLMYINGKGIFLKVLKNNFVKKRQGKVHKKPE